MRKSIIIFLALLSLAVGGYLLLTYNSSVSNNPATGDNQSEQTNAPAEDATDEELPTNEQVDEQIDDIEQKQNPEESPKPASVTPIITQAEYREDDNKVIVKAFIPDSSEGTCTVIYSKGSASFTETSGTSFVGNYYQCDGFSTNSSKFSSKGTWSVRIEFQSETQSGKSESRNITIE